MSGWFPRPASPRAFWTDLRAFLLAQERHKLVFAAIAIGITSLIVTGFIVESRYGVLPGPQTIYASDWSTSRTDAEIIAQQKIDAKALHAAKAERRRQFQKVDNAMTRMGF